MMLVVVGLMVDDRGRLLIQERPRSGLRGGLWEYPGGKVHDGECMEGALQREWDEELGMHIEVGRFITECVLSFEDAPHVLLALFAVRPSDADQLPMPSMGQTVCYAPITDILNRPCVPSMKVFHPDVERHLARLKSYGTVSGFAR